MKHIDDTHCIATEQEMVDAGLIECNAREENLLRLWSKGLNKSNTSWFGVCPLVTEIIPCQDNNIYEIDGTTFYIAFIKPPCLDRYFKGSDDRRVFINGIQVFYEKDGVTLMPMDKDNFSYSQLSDVSAQCGYPMPCEAFEHNHKAWKTDFKSGFVGASHFMFSPCGCNLLRFDIEKFKGADYQETYCG